jgi:hypothetical protein
MRNILRFWMTCLVITALLAVATRLASATSAPLLSGTYSVVENKPLGVQVQIRLRIHLTNRGSSDLSIQRMTLWDSSHPQKGASQACALMLRARTSADTTQEFTLSRSDYQQWHKGFRPRFVFEIAVPASLGRAAMRNTAVVRLDRSVGQEGR